MSDGIDQILKPLTIGIVGAGRIVEDVHLPVLKNIPLVRISWITDVDSKNRKRVGSMYGIKERHPDKVFSGPEEIDIYLLAIPLNARDNYLRSIAASGNAAYVEKPFASSAKDHRDIISHFVSGNIFSGFQRRFYNTAQTLKAIVDGGEFGRLHSVRAFQGSYNLRSNFMRAWGEDQKRYSGGLVMDSAIHILDQILYALSCKKIRSVSADGIVHGGVDYDVRIKSILTREDGDVEADCRFSRLTNLGDRIELLFDKARVECGLQPSDPVLAHSKGRRVRYQSSFSFGRYFAAKTVNQAFAYNWMDCIRSARNGVAAISSAKNSILTSEWVEEIYKCL